MNQQTTDGTTQKSQDVLKVTNSQSAADIWILSRLNETVSNVTRLIDNFQFSLAGETLRDFTWNEFADWYVEIHKVEGNTPVLSYVFETLLKLWHPFMPFVTETLWSNLHDEKDAQLLLVTPWPAPQKYSFTKQEADFSFTHVIEIITKIRAIRSAYHVDPGQEISATILGAHSSLKKTATIIQRLARLHALYFSLEDSTSSEDTAHVTFENEQLFIHLGTSIDIAKERARLEKEQSKLRAFIHTTEERLSAESFRSKAPQQIIKDTEARLAAAQKKSEELREIIGEKS